MQQIALFFCAFGKKVVILQAEKENTMKQTPKNTLISKPNTLRKYIIFSLFLLLMAATATGCDKEKPLEATGGRGNILKVEELKTLPLSDVKKYAGDTLDKDNKFLLYGIKCYRLTYTTIYENEPIATTALMLLPDNDTVKQRLCVYMHGTNVPVEPVSAAQKMPSNYFKHNQKGGEVAVCAIPLASNGFSVVMPDYIGYGDTKDKEHPFVYYPELHFANIDALRAMCHHLQLSGKQDVWLGGYSQGGGAALSLHYYIQTDYSSEFNVISSSCLSGPYNYVGQIEGVLRENINIPAALVSWSAYVLNRFAVHRNPDQIYSFTVTDQTSAIMNFQGGIWDLFRPYFVEGILSGEDTEWIAASEKNSFHKGWKPTGKVFLHHGTADTVVPYFNTTDAYNGLTQAGGDITVFTYEGKEHTNVTVPYIRNTLDVWNK